MVELSIYCILETKNPISPYVSLKTNTFKRKRLEEGVKPGL
jgi:hypothetical protein